MPERRWCAFGGARFGPRGWTRRCARSLSRPLVQLPMNTSSSGVPATSSMSWTLSMLGCTATCGRRRSASTTSVRSVFRTNGLQLEGIVAGVREGDRIRLHDPGLRAEVGAQVAQRQPFVDAHRGHRLAAPFHRAVVGAVGAHLRDHVQREVLGVHALGAARRAPRCERFRGCGTTSSRWRTRPRCRWNRGRSRNSRGHRTSCCANQRRRRCRPAGRAAGRPSPGGRCPRRRGW